MQGTAPGDDDQELDQRNHRHGFSIVWTLLSVIVQLTLTAAVVIGLPMVMHSLDLEGSHGIYTCVAIWFVGGMLIGLISPGRTFVEPVIGAFVVAVPTVYYLVVTQTVRTMPTFMYVIIGIVGLLFAFVGAYSGERIQMGPPARVIE